jgi:hypothetical protein
MKALASLVIGACLLTGCTDTSSSAADSSGLVNGRRDFLGKTLNAPVATPTSGVSARASGVIGGVSDAPSLSQSVGAVASSDEAASQSSSGADPLQNVNAAASPPPTMVIRTGQAFIEVDKVDPAVLRIRQLTAQLGGYITNSAISGGNDQIRVATLELKIPVTKYDQAVGSLSTIGKVETVNSTAQDVGEEFVDVSARVKNSGRLEERLISLLATRTGKLDEVLRVERELARVREEIERYEGRLRYLSARVAMSTLSITVHEPAPILGNTPGENPIAAAMRRAWKNFVGLVAALIASLGVAIPLALIAIGGWTGYRRWKSRKISA